MADPDMGDLRAAEMERELAAARAELPEWVQGLVHQECENGVHPEWFINSERHHRCPWCAIATAEQAVLDVAQRRIRDRLSRSGAEAGYGLRLALDLLRDADA